FTIFVDAHELENNKHEDNFQHCCGSPGESPGWKNSIHRLPYLNADQRLDSPTPSGCCKACVANESMSSCVNRKLVSGVCDYPTLNGTPLKGTLLQNEPWQTAELFVVAM
ncbi:9846_t:CDS:2, partial [Gigaspora margarita]